MVLNSVYMYIRNHPGDNPQWGASALDERQ